MKYTIIGILWKDEYEEKLFYEKKIDNPDFKPEHVSCIHINRLSEERKSEMIKKREYCGECGRRAKWIKNKPHITVKKPYSWVTTYEKNNIDILVLTNPWNLHEYIISIDRVRNKKWLSCIITTNDEICSLEAEDILAFKSFTMRFFETSDLKLVNI